MSEIPPNQPPIPPMQPPRFESNYPRQSQIDMAYVRPPGVYFDSIGIAVKMIQASLSTYVLCSLLIFAAAGAGYGLLLASVFSSIGFGSPGRPPDIHLGPITLLAMFVFYFLMIFGFLGLISVGVQHAKGQPASISDFFIPFRRFGTVICTVFIWGIPGFIYYGLSYSTMGSARSMNAAAMNPIVLLWEMIFIVISCAMIGPSYMSMTRAVFGGVGPIQSITQTFQRLKWSFLLLSLLYFIAAILSELGIVACCVGIIFTLPILSNTIALHYLYYFPPSEESGPRWANERSVG